MQDMKPRRKKEDRKGLRRCFSLLLVLVETKVTVRTALDAGGEEEDVQRLLYRTDKEEEPLKRKKKENRDAKKRRMMQGVLWKRNNRPSRALLSGESSRRTERGKREKRIPSMILLFFPRGLEGTHEVWAETSSCLQRKDAEPGKEPENLTHPLLGQTSHVLVASVRSPPRREREKKKKERSLLLPRVCICNFILFSLCPCCVSLSL